MKVMSKASPATIRILWQAALVAASWAGAGTAVAQTSGSALAPKQAKPFSMIVVSDPQYPRSNAGMPDAAASTAGNVASRAAMDALIRTQTSAPVKGVIFNGDLTEYGQSEQLDKLREFYGSLSVPRYFGLGNHDYQNNIDDSGGVVWPNINASRMVDFIRDEMRRQIPGIALDWRESTGTTYSAEGSLAYSWDVEHVHFVQLHNFPLYEQYWGDYRSDLAGWVKITIKNSLAWLEKDLAAARANGQAIILNMHEANGPWWSDASWKSRTPRPENAAVIQAAMTNRQANIAQFASLLSKYKVAAVFAGHYHGDFGLQNKHYVGLDLTNDVRTGPPPQIPSTPIFLAGSAFGGKLLLVEFDGNNQMKVSTASGASPTQTGALVSLDRSQPSAGCPAQTWRVQSDHSWAEFRIPASLVGTQITIPAGAYNNYAWARCNRVWWDQMGFTCKADQTWAVTGRYDADGYCTGSPTPNPYLFWGTR